MRHEIIALHIAGSFQKAEFYPSCAQLSISGSGSDRPSSDELVSLPGAYSDNDKGIFVNVFDGLKPEDYVFPGPPIARVAQGTAVGAGAASGGSNGGGSGNNGGGNGGGNGGHADAGKSRGKTCRLKKGAKSQAVLASEVRPRHISRIMRRLAASLGGSRH